MAEKVRIIDLDIDISAFAKKAGEARTLTEKLKLERKALDTTTKEGAEEFAKLSAEIDINNKKYRDQKNALGAVIGLQKDSASVTDEETRSKAKVREETQRLIKLSAQIQGETEEEIQTRKQLNDQIDKNTDFIKDNSSEYEKTKINIGNYKESIKEALQENSEFNKALDKQLETIPFVGPAFIAAKRSTLSFAQSQTVATASSSALSKGLKILRIAIISTGIGAIVILLGSLVAAFLSTQKGADKVTEALAPIKGAVQGIIGVFQNLATNIFSQLGDRFTIVSNSIQNGLAQISLGWNKITGDSEEAEQIQSEINKRTEESAVAQESLNKKTEEFGKIVAGAGEQIKESAKSQTNIAQLQIDIENAENRLIISRSESARIIKAQNKIAEDTTKTLEEREKAAQKAIDESNKLLGEQQNILDLKIKQKKIELSQNDTDRAAQGELNELIAQRNDAETSALEEQTTLTNKLNILKTQLIKQETDEIVNNAAKELQIFKDTNAQKLADNKFFTDQLLAEEQAKLEAVATKEKEFQAIRLANGVINQTQFNSEIERINKENETKQDENIAIRDQSIKDKKVIDVENQRIIDEENKLTDFQIQSQNLEIERQAELESAKKSGADIAEINQKFDERSIKLKKETESVKLASTADSFNQIGGLLDKESDAGKAVALAQASINVAQGVTKAIAQGGLAGIVTGAVTAAAGLKSLRQISNTKKPEIPTAADGGMIPKLNSGVINNGSNLSIPLSNGDDTLAYVKQGEVILNSNHQAKAGGPSFFRNLGVKGFANSGIAGGSTSLKGINTGSGGNESIDYKRFGEAVGNANRQLPAPQLDLVTLADAQNNLTDIVSGGNR